MSREGIRIQPDWDKAILEKDRSFWFHLYDPYKTRYQRVEINDNSLSSDNSDVECSVTASKTIRFKDNARHLQSTFQCPDFRFTTVHKQSRQPTLHLNSFDVNGSGELGVSATSDGNVFLWETKTSEIRRKFVGHASEVYCSRFFPSGLVVLTGGADMQLRIWCALTGTCAATLRAGLGGAPVESNAAEPGGHRAGVIDVDFIDRGRNIVALDRGGWLRLWDVSTQIAISAMSVTSQLPGAALQANCALDDAPACCAIKRRISTDEAVSRLPTESTENFCTLESSSARATVAGVTDKLAVVGCGTNGHLLIFDISSPDTRRQGPALHLNLPCASGAVTACAVSTETDGEAASGIFNEYGLIAGGSAGEIACWDLRNYRTPMFTYGAYKYGVCALKVANFPAQSMNATGSESVSMPAFTGLFSAFRDGRTILRRIPEGDSSDSVDGFSRCVELTGPETEAICGMRVPNAHSPSVWTGTYSAHFFGYRRISVEGLFS